MLPAEHRLRRQADFSEVVRRGRRASRPLLTVHVLTGTPSIDTPHPGTPADGAPAVTRAGLVVSKGVGGSVVRHRTARRLRHLLRDRLELLPPGSRLVVRASPAAGQATSALLAADLDAALGSVRRPRAVRA